MNSLSNTSSVKSRSTNSSTTYFAPAGRASPDTLKTLAKHAINNPVIKVILDAVSGQVLVLNETRQVLAANKTLLKSLGIGEMDELIGRRPGELLACEHCNRGPDGCGTSKNCRFCGAVMAILAAQSGGCPADEECWLTSIQNGKRISSEFRVRVTPLELFGHRLLAFVLQDISAQKRREVLERVFFHDIRNTLSSLFGWIELLKIDNPKVAADMLLSVANQLNREIDDQYILTRAETGELAVKREIISVDALFNDIKAICSSAAEMLGKNFEAFCRHPDCSFETDYSLLLRVLINMLKNAFEASPKGGTVRLWFERGENQPAFFVNNSGVIASRTARRIFQRSFSTKGENGHGIGAYSMKLLGEQYLGGEVSFDTNKEEGTTFSIVLPKIVE